MIPGLEKLMDTCVAETLDEDKKDDKLGSDNISIIVISFLH
jgi:hypothetical protein